MYIAYVFEQGNHAVAFSYGQKQPTAALCFSIQILMYNNFKNNRILGSLLHFNKCKMIPLKNEK